MESAPFSHFGENARPVWRFWQLWRSKMRFGQNVLRMTEKDRFVQFSWKAHCFPGLKRIWGQCDDFENFDAHKCDLAKTCCAWPEKNVCTIFTKSAQFLPFEGNLRQVWRFWKLWRSLMRFAKTCFHGKHTVFLVWRELEASVTILRTLTLKNAIWPKRAAHDLKRAFCTIFMESELFSWFEENLRPVWRFWELWRSQMRFGQIVLRMTWKERLYKFYEKRTVFPFWREFETSVTILKTLTLTNAIWPKRAAHDLKITFGTIFIKSALFSLFGENLRPVWRIWQPWRSKMRFGQNLLRMIWKQRFVQFSWKAHSFPV